MADLGSTIYLESNPLAPANGTDGYGNFSESGSLTTGQSMIRMNFGADHFSDLGNTVLFPASAYESIVEPAMRFYKLRGYYVSGSIYETWVTQNPESAPPSGHTLSGIAVVDTWIS